MLTLLNVPDRVDPTTTDLGGAPHAADESNINHDRHVFGYPTFIRWPARDHRGDRVMVLVGFNTINSYRINAVLKNERAAIQAAANAVHSVGIREVVLIAA